MAQQQKALEPKEKTTPIITDTETIESIFEQFKDTAQAIGKRAFEFFDKRGQQFGYALEDWLRAESELIRRVPLEVKEMDGNLSVRAEVPGFKPEELKVLVEANRLTISGETEQKTEKKDDNTLYSEWRTQKVFRAFDLPFPVKPAEVTAKLNDGVLSLTMPKAETMKPTEIEVKTT
jgi:HSP20 family molecular chaperone IbpA